MSMLEEITPSPRKVMTLFYLVDTSGSMSGTRIGTVNSAMEECIPMLQEVAQANDDAEIKVAILQFSSGCSWITPESGPVGLDDLIWNDLQAGGITDFGAALLELVDRKSISYTNWWFKIFHLVLPMVDDRCLIDFIEIFVDTIN